jgi:hypothetical protein
MKPEEVNNRKDAMIYFLLMLNERGKQIDLGEFLFSSGYTHGIESFEGLMNEMEKKGWINIRKTPSGTVPGMPWLQSNRMTYEISLDGIEYLSSLGLIEDKFKIKENKPKKIKQTNISGGQVIINKKKNKGNQSLLDNAFDSPTTQKISKQTDKKPKRSWLEILAWITGIIVSIIAIYEFLLK